MSFNGKQFYYSMPTNYVFGTKAMDRFAEVIAPYKRVLFVHGAHALKALGLDVSIRERLEQAGTVFEELSDAPSNPTDTYVERVCKMCQSFQPDLILAVGGGSVIDAAKAAAVLYGARQETGADCSYVEALAGLRGLQQALPVGVVLTLPASGSECNNSFVIHCAESGKKLARAHKLATPKFALCNPETMETLSEKQLACACADIMAHLLEQLFCAQDYLDHVDNLIYASISSLIDSWELLKNEDTAQQARQDIMALGSLGLSYFLSVGRPCDWVAHEIDHRLSGRIPAAHGHVLSVVMPAWVRTMAENPYYRLRLQGFEERCPYTMKNHLTGLGTIQGFYDGLGLPADVVRNAVGANVDEAVRLIMDAGPLGRCEALTEQTCRTVLEGL